MQKCSFPNVLLGIAVLEDISGGKSLLCLCPCVSQVLNHFTGLLLAFRESLTLNLVSVSRLHTGTSFSINCLAGDRMWSLSMYVWLWSNKSQTLSGLNKCYYSYQLKITKAVYYVASLVA